ncbi:MFS transporter [Actinomadura oligospora]|uniref:MFS transporter n=1 Tax=Actinomadura oligospora TaxID=111804 RepID=UPI0012F85AD0|nr:MFS transporter [Actinomadura oligospora]
MTVLTSRPRVTTGPLSLPRPFWTLWLGIVINRSGAVVQPFLAVYLVRAQGFTSGQAGATMAAFGAGSLLSHVLAGALADRFGRRLTLTGGMLATSAAMVALGAAQGFTAVVVTAFLLGLTIESYRPASQAMVADLVSPESRPKAYGLLFWAMNLGYSIAMLTGGWLAGHGAQTMFGVNAAVALAFAFVVWRALPEPRRSEKAVASPGLRSVLRNRPMVVLCFSTAAYGVLYAQAFTTLPLAMAGQGIGRVDYGQAMALNGVLIVLIQPVATRWLARLNHVHVLATGTAVVSAGFALTALVHNALGLALTVVVWTAGEIIVAGALATIVAALAPAGLQGTYAGISGMSWAAGAALAPVVGTLLLPLGAGPLWCVMGAIGATSALATFLTAPAVHRRTTA